MNNLICLKYNSKNDISEYLLPSCIFVRQSTQHLKKIRSYANNAPKGIIICQVHFDTIQIRSLNNKINAKITIYQLKEVNISRYGGKL